MTQHHFCGKNDRAWVHFVLTGIFRCSTVRGFEQCAIRTDVCARCDTDTANLRRQGVRDVVTVQVHTRDNVVFSRTQQDLLQECVSNYIFNDDFFAVVWVLNFHPRSAVDQLTAELFTRQLVTPILEGTFGELHDVAFVNQSQ